MTTKTFRSLLFVPAIRVDLIARAHERGADAIIIDLEDSIAAADKAAARSALPSALASLRSHGVPVLVRINCLDRGGALDIAALADTSTPLLIPKVSDPTQVEAVENCWRASRGGDSGNQTPTPPLWPMIESPQGMFRSEQIARATSAVSALVFGSEDFATAAGLNTDIEALATPAQWVTMAAAAAGIPAYGLPGSLGNYHDMALFATTLRRGKTIGFRGSLCIHPNQVSLANEVFRPSAEEVAWAKTVLAQSAGNRSQPETDGVSGGDAGMVDAPVVARARAILARL